jgi:hypothetical protein
MPRKPATKTRSKKVSGRARTSKATRGASPATGSEAKDASTSAPPATRVFHPLAAELASSLERDATLLARLAANQLGDGDTLLQEAKRLQLRAEAFWRALTTRMAALEHEPYFGSTAELLRVAPDLRTSRREGRNQQITVDLDKARARTLAQDSVSPDELRYLPLLRANIYPPAWDGISLAHFRWKRSRDGTIEALGPDSAQGLAISLWRSLAQIDSKEIRQVVEFYMGDRAEGLSEYYRPEHIRALFEIKPSTLRKSAPDHPRLGTVVEYGNPNSGWDSSTKYIVVETTTIDDDHQKCPGVTTGRCDGTFGNSGRGCPLSDAAAAEAFPWRRVRALCRTDAFEEGALCPFATENFHNMRVVAAAAAVRGSEGSVSVGLCYVGSWLDQAESIDRLRALLNEYERPRVVGIDLENVVDELIGCEDDAAADLGLFLWKRLRVVGIESLSRLVAAKLRDYSGAPTKAATAGRLRLPILRVLPRVPEPHQGRPFSLASNRWAGPYETLVWPFVHPVTGSEAFVTSDGSTIRVRVPLSENGEEVVAAVLAMFEPALVKKGPRRHNENAIGQVSAKNVGVDVEPALRVLEQVGFQADER